MCRRGPSATTSELLATRLAKQSRTAPAESELSHPPPSTPPRAGSPRLTRPGSASTRASASAKGLRLQSSVAPQRALFAASAVRRPVVRNLRALVQQRHQLPTAHRDSPRRRRDSIASGIPSQPAGRDRRDRPRGLRPCSASNYSGTELPRLGYEELETAHFRGVSHHSRFPDAGPICGHIER